MKIYEGKSVVKSSTSSESLSFRVVTDLLKTYIGRKYTIYMDSFFSSHIYLNIYIKKALIV